jgi:hypothetical protein
VGQHRPLSVPRIAFAGVVLAAALHPSVAASADAPAAPSVQAVMTCERATRPGRVRCDVEARVDGAETLRWGDVQILEVPETVIPLRGRIGPGDATVREPNLWRWEFAVIARSPGEATLSGQARLVLCRRDACMPHVVPVRGVLRVGPSE